MDQNKTAGIILAAGESKRLGRPKQLLDWFGKTFIEQIIDTALDAGLDPLIVVTGAFSDRVESSIKKKKVIVSRNDNWNDGQSSSLISGIRTLSDLSLEQFIVFLCDQPQIPVELIKMIIAEAQENDVKIVATSVNGKICPPILFKKECVTELLALKGDQGGRVIIEKYKNRTINFKDERLLLDSDTEEDYQKLIKSYI